MPSSLFLLARCGGTSTHIHNSESDCLRPLRAVAPLLLVFSGRGELMSFRSKWRAHLLSLGFRDIFLRLQIDRMASLAKNCRCDVWMDFGESPHGAVFQCIGRFASLGSGIYSVLSLYLLCTESEDSWLIVNPPSTPAFKTPRKDHCRFHSECIG